MSEATPRITAPYLEQFSHKTVRIIGKVRQLRGLEATIDANGQIKVHQQHDSNWHMNHAVEVVGRVQQDLSVKVMASTDLGPENEIDFDAIEAVVDATHRYSAIFYEREQ